MISQNDLQKIKKTVEEFFEKTSFQVKADVLPLEEQTIPIKVEAEEPKILIGQNGQTLSEIQHLLKAILRRKISDQFYIDLDVNNYKEKKAEYLKETAVSLADEVALSKKEKILPSMTAYERRIIHLELAARNDITTESIGDEPDRRIVIRPYL